MKVINQYTFTVEVQQVKVKKIILENVISVTLVARKKTKLMKQMKLKHSDCQERFSTSNDLLQHMADKHRM